MTTECETNCATFEIIEGQKVTVRVADGKVTRTQMPRTPAHRIWMCNNCGKLPAPELRPVIAAAYEKASKGRKL